VDDDGVTVLELRGRHNGLLLVLYHVGPFVVLDGAKVLGKDSDGSVMVGSLVPLVGASDGVTVVGATEGVAVIGTSVGASEGSPVGAKVALKGAAVGVAVGALLFHRQVGCMDGRCVSRFHHMGCRVVELVGAMVLGKDSDGSLMVGSLVPLVGATDGVAVVGATVGSSVGVLEVLVGLEEGREVSVGIRLGASVGKHVAALGNAVG